jgi:hypothetical protein
VTDRRPSPVNAIGKSAVEPRSPRSFLSRRDTSYLHSRIPGRVRASATIGYNIENEVTTPMLKRAFTLMFLFVVTLTVSAQWAANQEDQGVPAFNSAPPPKGKKLPPFLPKESLWAENAQFPYQTHAYELAAKIPNVIHQEPCYCYCDRGMGHNSLHSCFENTHGAQCDVCLKELYYSYAQTKKGKTPAQIRAGITKGEWKQVDLQTAADIN